MLVGKYLFTLVLLILYAGHVSAFFEVLAGLGSYLYENYLQKSYCTRYDIPANFEALKDSLEEKLYGQPLVQKTIVNSLKSHWDDKYIPSKALSLSLHGGPGVGKNYVTRIIQEALFTAGIKHPHVHTFVARIDFPETTQVERYQVNLINWIKGNVTKCPKQIFIFDEVNQMVPGLLDVIKPFIDYNYIHGIDYSRVVFIFLSNTGMSEINSHMFKLWKNGINRDTLKLSNFEKMISQGAFNEKGGFYLSENIKSNLIDHYIPFLPLMEEHVRKCIRHEFEKRGQPDPYEEQIKEVLDCVEWGPEEAEIFAKTGCKRISQKVASLV